MTNERVEVLPVSEAALLRYGFKWQGHDHGTHEIMPDGYWTPWHIATERIAELEARLSSQSLPVEVRGTVERELRAILEMSDTNDKAPLSVSSQIATAAKYWREGMTSSLPRDMLESRFDAIHEAAEDARAALNPSPPDDLGVTGIYPDGAPVREDQGTDIGG